MSSLLMTIGLLMQVPAEAPHFLSEMGLSQPSALPYREPAAPQPLANVAPSAGPAQSGYVTFRVTMEPVHTEGTSFSAPSTYDTAAYAEPSAAPAALPTPYETTKPVAMSTSAPPACTATAPMVGGGTYCPAGGYPASYGVYGGECHTFCPSHSTKCHGCCVKPVGDLYQHHAYTAYPKLYYYFRPYNHLHVRDKAAQAMSLGAHEKAPFSNALFQDVYPAVEARFQATPHY